MKLRNQEEQLDTLLLLLAVGLGDFGLVAVEDLLALELLRSSHETLMPC